ncbi:MAG: BASS family bile acid:Na+ symporter [Halioglobus sp.]|jgi:BASS family bile acid:Na+ symporter
MRVAGATTTKTATESTGDEETVLTEFTSNYAAYEYPLAASQLFLAMLGMGALLTPRDFMLEIQRPKGLLVGISFQWLLVPLIAFAVGAVLPVPAGIAAGLIMVAAVPGGTLSNILTLYGRGNIALSISLTSLTTVAALAATPLLLKIYLSQYLPENFTMPTGRIAVDIFFTLIIPLLLGMLVQARASIESSARFSKISIRVSLMLIVVMVVGAGGSGRLSADAYGVMGIAALVIFALAVQGSCILASRLLDLPHRDGLAILIEATFRNISLAVAVKAVVFPAQPGVLDPIGDAVLFVTFLYGGISMFLSVVPMLMHRRITPQSYPP